MEGILDLEPKELLRFCSDNPQALKTCKSIEFWKEQIKLLSLRDLQEEWLIFVAKRGNSKLLSLLIEACDESNITIDERTYLYMAYNLLEKRVIDTEFIEELSERANVFKTKSDIFEFYDNMVGEITFLRDMLLSGDIAAWKPVSKNSYNIPYEVDLMFRTVRDILPPLQNYFRLLSNIQNIEEEKRIKTFIILVVGIMVKYNMNEEVKDILDDAKSEVSEKFLYMIYASILDNGTYNQAKRLVNHNVWPKLAKLDILPRDPNIYYDLVEMSEYDITKLSSAEDSFRYRPKEWIRYLNLLLRQKIIKEKTLIQAVEVCLAESGFQGYTDFENVVRDYLESLI